MFDRQQPYNELPLLGPSVALETVEVMRKAISANRELAELKGVGDLIPNQSLLIDSIVLQEAKDSSEIENIVTTNDQLYRAQGAHSGGLDSHTKEVLKYKSALWEGYEASKQRPMSIPTIELICNTIKGNNAGVRVTTGTTISNAETGEVIYTPPEGEAVIKDKLSNLLSYMHTDDGVDPLIKMAVIHYQFEAIHPFSDGNGRTGRIINILYLLDQGLLQTPVLYLSRYIIKNKVDYYKRLRGVTERGEWKHWVLYMLSAVEETAKKTRVTILKIRSLLEETKSRVQEELPSVYSRELIEIIFQQPYCRISYLVDAGIAKRQTASEYLKKLEEKGVLMSYKIGRDKVYLNYPLFELLTE